MFARGHALNYPLDLRVASGISNWRNQEWNFRCQAFMTDVAVTATLLSGIYKWHGSQCAFWFRFLMQLSTVIDVPVHFMSAMIAAWLSTSTTILWLCIFSKSRFFATSEIAKTSAWNTVLCRVLQGGKMLVLESFLGILHKNPHLLSHLLSSHQCKLWQCSDLECFRSDSILFIHNLTFEISLECLCFLFRSVGICSKGKNLLASLQTSTWLFVSPKEPTRLTCQSPLTVILYDPRIASANKNSSMGIIMSNISRAPVGVPRKAAEIIRQASLCTFVNFHSKCFLLQPPAQDIHAYNMIGRIIAVYIHFIIDGFIPHVFSHNLCTFP